MDLARLVSRDRTTLSSSIWIQCAASRELCFIVQDHEHLFALIVEVMADPALRIDGAAMQKEQVGVQRVLVERASASSHCVATPC